MAEILIIMVMIMIIIISIISINIKSIISINIKSIISIIIIIHWCAVVSGNLDLAKQSCFIVVPHIPQHHINPITMIMMMIKIIAMIMLMITFVFCISHKFHFQHR